MAKKQNSLPHLDLDTLSEGGASKNSKQLSLLEDSLGKTLRKARLDQKQKLPEISKKLRIKLVYLEALEQGHYYAFPGLSYGIGFLKTYAASLGLDPAEMVAKFHQETLGIKEQPIEAVIKTNKNALPSGRIIGRVILLIAVFYLAWYLFSEAQMDYYVKKWLSGTLPQTEISDVENESVTFTGGDIDLTDVPVTSDDLVSGLPASVTPQAATTGIFKVYGLKKPARVSLLATQKTFIEVRDSARVLFSTTLESGDQYNVPRNSADLVLSVDMPKALTVFIDGKPLQPLAGDTKKEYSLDVDALKKM
ncbi:MAG: DUF4115 domain-containing protein [Lactobacillales bacterium]|jgi:cytoskeleton protein RodZ|nr:DUF4115 domain-containing protein [Lactobacillales bacterium]